ncbi:hypothetical protein [Symbiopectobacterium purcellii]|uniref:Uncharacterized protein n=1 Tax=Symbiopectobacterium purcellii TaxID=2871826 RepID=A0ABX9AW95_9ENTR|nr:hypothetical protein [Symbiopectobacterium purcellii]QZN97704.1 hypothetical protein K6K13_10565 [Symbiopectobacterium purcellii]
MSKIPNSERDPNVIVGDILRFGGGNSGGGEVIDTRVVRLASDSENIKSTLKYIKDDVREIKREARCDFRILFGVLIVLVLGLAGIMSKGFGWLYITNGDEDEKQSRLYISHCDYFIFHICIQQNDYL